MTLFTRQSRDHHLAPEEGGQQVEGTMDQETMAPVDELEAVDEEYGQLVLAGSSNVGSCGYGEGG